MLKLIFSLLFSIFQICFCNAVTITDSVIKQVEVRDLAYNGSKSIDTSLLSGLRKDSDFNYYEDKPQESGFLRWLFKKIGNFFSSLYQYKATPYIFYVVFGVLFLILLYKLFDKKVHAVFIPSKRVKVNTNIGEVDINLPDYENLIAEALKNHDLQAAVRFMYLKLLQELNSRNIIIWKADKTTFDYLSEIKQANIGIEFLSLSGMYEYVWYGKCAITTSQCETIKSRFEKTYKLLNGKN